MGVRSAFQKLTQNIKRWTWHHVTAFFITYLVYALFRACRKSFSNVKNMMTESVTPHGGGIYPYQVWQKERWFETQQDANVFLGELDGLFLFAYGGGMYVSGAIGDRVNLRYMLSFSMIGTSVITFLFGYVAVPLHIENKWFYRSLFLINGLFQSTAWPALIAVMANWFKSSKGLVFGLWVSNSYIGNMVGALIIASVVDYGYEYGMLMNCILCFCGAFIVLFCLIPDPKTIGLEKEEEGSEEVEKDKKNDNEKNKDVIELEGDDNTQNQDEVILQPAKAIKFYEAFLIPGVIPYTLAYAAVKIVMYSFFFWLPAYLAQGKHWSDKVSDNISNFFDVGAMIGTVMAGIVSDMFVFRSPIVSSNLGLSALFVYLYLKYGTTYVSNAVLMVFVGFSLGAPDCLLSSVISSDLGNHKKLAGNKKAVATVSGIMDGTGALGASLGQLVVAVIAKYYGWRWVFNFLLIMAATSFLLILPIVYKELRAWRKTRKDPRTGNV